MKPGDKVRVVAERPKDTKTVVWTNWMDDFLGQIVTLDDQDSDGDWRIEEAFRVFSPEWLIPVTTDTSTPATQEAQELLAAIETLKKHCIPEPDAPCIRFARALVQGLK